MIDYLHIGIALLVGLIIGAGIAWIAVKHVLEKSH